MTLIVEDGSGVSGANTYVSAQDAVAFFSLRGIVLTEETVKPFLINAMDALGSLCFKGVSTYSENALHFPIDTSTQIPPEVLTGQLWIANYARLGHLIGDVSTPAIKKEKVDVLETEYAVSELSSTAIELRDLPYAYSSIKHLLKTNYGNNGKVQRA